MAPAIDGRVFPCRSASAARAARYCAIDMYVVARATSPARARNNATTFLFHCTVDCARGTPGASAALCTAALVERSNAVDVGASPQAMAVSSVAAVVAANRDLMSLSVEH